ncbi:MAG TPA: S8 family serine peptidase, partial [Gemmatimonadaceae bacterium]|nr:S8 family serine peptidase [Gemmatimonadaceae bacterium]
MNGYRLLLGATLALGVAACESPQGGITSTDVGAPRFQTSASQGMIGIDVVLNTAPTPTILSDLGTIGTVLDVIPEINSLTMRIASSALPAVQQRPYVKSAAPDAERDGTPVDLVAASNFTNGFSTWDQDAINVTMQPLSNVRAIPETGDGVYVGILDTGLLDSWRQYFPQERIAEQYGIAFGGGGGGQGTVSSQPNKWEHDQNSHGTHVTSTILGYNFSGVPINGVAPMATVIPVKVLNQNGKGWSSVIARGIVYIADLKAGPLAGHPMVINMSLGGPESPIEEAAIDYAISKGVIIVAAAGNAGDAGMDYPGAYAPVISAAASGWVGEWLPDATGATNSWWLLSDVPDPTNANDYYIASFSGRAKAGQDLDVAAPGSWVVGPYQTQSGTTSYFFLGGTSMASPHVAGIVALMAQKQPSLTASEAEDILERTAVPLPPGSRTIRNPDGTSSVVTWGADATGAGLATANAALAGMT